LYCINDNFVEETGIMNRKKCIVFDLGGIFVPDNTKLLNREIARYLGISAGEMAAYWTGALPELFTGHMKIIDFYESRFGSTHDPDFLLQKHLEIYTGGYEMNPSMLELLKNLNLKYTTACLSNTESEVSEINSELGLYENFHHKFLSTEMQMMKPDRDIFISAIQKLNASPGDIIFIDDKEENIKTGALLGLKTILFESADRTKELLSQYLSYS
jgi:putative hydrolase of the HAD superfamily